MSLSEVSPPPMRSHDKERIPRILLRAMVLLVVASLCLASYARLTGRPLEATPPEGPVADQRLLRIYAEMSGAARVLDAQGMFVAELAPEAGGFIAGVSRALARVRRPHGVAADAPVRLIQYQDGRLALKDDATGWRMEIAGFGADNRAAFAKLFRQARAAGAAQGADFTHPNPSEPGRDEPAPKQGG